MVELYITFAQTCFLVILICWLICGVANAVMYLVAEYDRTDGVSIDDIIGAIALISIGALGLLLAYPTKFGEIVVFKKKITVDTKR